MKNATLLLFALYFTNINANTTPLTFKNLQGTYQVTYQDTRPVFNILTINDNGFTRFIESSPVYILDCQSQSILKNQIVYTNFTCNHNTNFNQEIDFNEIKRFNKFIAPVYNSGSDETVEMIFEKID